MDTTISLAAIPADPTLQNIQFSPDGQVLLATRHALYILTPDLGVNFDASSTAKILTGDFGWFRAIIDVGDIPPQNWFIETQEWAAVSFGSIERTLRSIAVSPAFVTTNGGSVIAILTSDMTLTFWAAPKNPIRGGWNKVQLPPCMLFSRSRMDYSLHAYTAIAWSSEPTFASSSGSLNSGSLLAVGTRAGSVHLLRYLDSAEQGESAGLVLTVEVGDRWVTQCAWTPWKTSDAQIVLSTLACGLSNGDVILIDVTQTLPSGSPFNLEVVTKTRNEKAASPDKRIITAMKWVSRKDGAQILVYCKPGTAHLYASPSPNALWSGLVDVRLQNQKTSRNSSELHPCCGIEYNQENGSVVLAIADGSLHVVGDLDRTPKYVNSAESGWSSHGLSTLARGLFVKSEGGGATEAMTCKISGMTSICSGSILLWLFEAVHPSDFSYKHRADRSINLALTQISGRTDESMPDGLSAVLDAPPTGRCWQILSFLQDLNTTAGQLPVATLFSAFLYLHNPERLKEALGRILELLKLEDGSELAAPDISHPSDPFQMHFETLLYGDQELSRLRLKLCVADFCWKWLNGAEDLQKLCGEAAVSILRAISRRTFLVYLVLGLLKASLLTAGDCVFLRRVILQTRSDGESQLLQSKALELERLLQTMPIAGGLPIEEECPACKSEIPFRDIRTAACQNGHPWTRCSITTLVLATSQVRTCLGCTRKAFSPVQSGFGGHPPVVAESQFMAGVLQTATRCLFCGNRFVYLL
ncbi:putative zinc-finger of transcription factor IIIC complex-domain-containing protein [Thelephora terrestris]|uniref:Zinc-finger of transcription factor IIIC complex-domain-containing protein n=1 Tax=Thelephora terrestris TaxID=56493 RepID=A0A9P6HEV1_9AGAM|nr:putative zinc-finger of transcription factor IIIC complex-domain-containing protein [Thelephora terrestris]